MCIRSSCILDVGVFFRILWQWQAGPTVPQSPTAARQKGQSPKLKATSMLANRWVTFKINDVYVHLCNRQILCSSCGRRRLPCNDNFSNPQLSKDSHPDNSYTSLLYVTHAQHNLWRYDRGTIIESREYVRAPTVGKPTCFLECYVFHQIPIHQIFPSNC